MSKFGDRLRELREEKELMSKDFAKIMNVEPATVTNWEKGKRFPKDDVLLKIADYFNVSIDYLLGREYKEIESLKEGKESLTMKLLKKIIAENDIKNVDDIKLSQLNELIDMIQEDAKELIKDKYKK